MLKKISLGNFNNLAKQYKNSRPGYSDKITKLLKLILLSNKTIYSLDLGSGTGIFSKELSKISKKVIGVEISNEMIRNSHKLKKVRYINKSVDQFKSDKKFNIISAASCFHWLNNEKLSKLVNSNLKKNGIFLIGYNTRDISNNKFLIKVEQQLFKLNKDFKKRISSGNSNFVENKIKHFVKISKIKGPIYFEFVHYEKFSKKRYFSVWDSSNEMRNKLDEKKYNLFKKWLDINFKSKYIKAKYINKFWIFQN